MNLESISIKHELIITKETPPGTLSGFLNPISRSSSRDHLKRKGRVIFFRSVFRSIVTIDAEKRGTDGTMYGPEIGLEAAVLSVCLSLSLFLPPLHRFTLSRSLSTPRGGAVRCDFPAATYAGLYITSEREPCERGERRSSYRSTAEQ